MTYHCDHCGWIGDTPAIAGITTNYHACPLCGWAVNDREDNDAK